MIESILNENVVITIIGSGGKTTTMYYLAEKFVEKFNKNVLVTTTTKIFKPNKYPTIISNNIEEIIKVNSKIVVAGGGLISENKITSLKIEILYKLKKYFSLILIEGDGSKGKSLKAYKEYEPVIPDFTDKLITVIGLDILDKPFSEKFIHRFEIMKKIIKIQENSKLDVQNLIEIIEKCYIPVIPDFTENFLILNKIDKQKIDNAIQIKKEIERTRKFKEIFLNYYNT